MSDENKKVYWDTDQKMLYWIEWEETGNNDIPHRHYIESGVSVQHKACACVKSKSSKSCSWKYDENLDRYHTTCDNAHQFSEGDIGANNYKYCPYCGGKIKDISYRKERGS